MLRPNYVDEGQFFAFPLEMPGESLAIDPEASWITTLAASPDGKVVFGATKGSACHLFAAYFKGAGGGVLDLGAVSQATSIPALIPQAAGKEGGPVVLAAINRQKGFAIMNQPTPNMRDMIQEPGYLHAGPSCVYHADSGCLLDAICTDSQRLVCLTTQGLIAVDLSKGNARSIDAAGSTASGSAKLVRIGPCCYWLDDQGIIRGIELSSPEKITAGPARWPGRRPVTALMADGRGGAVAADELGDIYRFEPGTAEIRRVGRAVLPEVQCMACLPDGRVYGMAGREMGHFFRCNLATGSTVALGAVASALGAARRYAFAFSCAAVSVDGTIFFGEYDRGGHLWAYYPPLPER